MCSLVGDPFNTRTGADYQRVAQVEKEPGLENAGNTLKLLIEQTWVANRGEFTIDDLVTAVGQVG